MNTIRMSMYVVNNGENGSAPLLTLRLDTKPNRSLGSLLSPEGLVASGGSSSNFEVISARRPTTEDLGWRRDERGTRREE